MVCSFGSSQLFGLGIELRVDSSFGIGLSFMTVPGSSLNCFDGWSSYFCLASCFCSSGSLLSVDAFAVTSDLNHQYLDYSIRFGFGLLALDVEDCVGRGVRS